MSRPHLGFLRPKLLETTNLVVILKLNESASIVYTNLLSSIQMARVSLSRVVSRRENGRSRFFAVGADGREDFDGLSFGFVH